MFFRGFFFSSFFLFFFVFSLFFFFYFLKLFLYFFEIQTKISFFDSLRVLHISDLWPNLAAIGLSPDCNHHPLPFALQRRIMFNPWRLMHPLPQKMPREQSNRLIVSTLDRLVWFYRHVKPTRVSFIPIGQGIAFIVRSYLYFLCSRFFLLLHTLLLNTNHF